MSTISTTIVRIPGQNEISLPMDRTKEQCQSMFNDVHGTSSMTATESVNDGIRIVTFERRTGTKG